MYQKVTGFVPLIHSQLTEVSLGLYSNNTLKLVLQCKTITILGYPQVEALEPLTLSI